MQSNSEKICQFCSYAYSYYNPKIDLFCGHSLCKECIFSKLIAGITRQTNNYDNKNKSKNQKTPNVPSPFSQPKNTSSSFFQEPKWTKPYILPINLKGDGEFLEKATDSIFSIKFIIFKEKVPVLMLDKVKKPFKRMVNDTIHPSDLLGIDGHIPSQWKDYKFSVTWYNDSPYHQNRGMDHSGNSFYLGGGKYEEDDIYLVTVEKSHSPASKESTRHELIKPSNLIGTNKLQACYSRLFKFMRVILHEKEHTIVTLQ
jgi:hypothetical protein